MNVKLIEIRDKGTFIPAIAIELKPHTVPEIYLMNRAGYFFLERERVRPIPHIMLTALAGGRPAHTDYYEWGGRTWPVIHKYLIEHWDEVESGQVLDVEFILGETTAPKISESIEHG